MGSAAPGRRRATAGTMLTPGAPRRWKALGYGCCIGDDPRRRRDVADRQAAAPNVGDGWPRSSAAGSGGGSRRRRDRGRGRRRCASSTATALSLPNTLATSSRSRIAWTPSRCEPGTTRRQPFVRGRRVDRHPQRDDLHRIERPVAGVLVPQHGPTRTRRLADVVRREERDVGAEEHLGEVDEPVVGDDAQPERDRRRPARGRGPRRAVRGGGPAASRRGRSSRPPSVGVDARHGRRPNRLRA